jgi:hypothetical protein
MAMRDEVWCRVMGTMMMVVSRGLALLDHAIALGWLAVRQAFRLPSASLAIYARTSLSRQIQSTISYMAPRRSLLALIVCHGPYNIEQ